MNDMRFMISVSTQLLHIPSIMKSYASRHQRLYILPGATHMVGVVDE
jgi:ABC-type hemin transport system substrate-binding protein